MKFLSWNCRGLANTSTIRSLRAIVRLNNPDVIFLSETKSAASVVTSVLLQLGFSNLVQAPPSSSRGGLLLAWKNDVNLNTFVVSSDIICAWCFSVDTNVKWMISFVYGPPYQKNSTDFWTNLAEYGISFNEPWLCLGDFNAITASVDKCGGRPFHSNFDNCFTRFINSMGMIDLGFSGNPYTWSNNRQGFGLIKERLDRAIASFSWIQSFPNFSVTHLPAYSSDHNPLILNTSLPTPSLPRPFRFEEFWTRDPSCRVVISEAWSIAPYGSPSFCLTKKLKNTKRALKYWNHHYFGDIHAKIVSTLKLLDDTQQSPSTDSTLAFELHLKSLLSDYLQQEESLWMNKSRELWLICGDLNTKFFHTSTLIRRRRNSIDRLFTPSGWISDRNMIGRSFVSHFKHIYTSTNCTPSPELLDLFDCSITDDDNLSLCVIPTESEIFEALSSLGRLKAPGPDGFTALFYVTYWDTIKTTVLSAIWNFFRHNQLLREQNHTFLALIPKKIGASSVQHFRPISLCNIIYKIISKLLANRLKPLLTKFISPFQTAFVPHRHIQDNSILAHEMLHTLKSKRGRGGLMAINLDMEKAFDKMEWSFLLAILHKLGFHSRWINWVRLCISTSSFSVMLNGSPFGLFSPSRGLRQGDPLSPFLFIIGSEVISRLLFGSLRGFKIARACSPLNHLLFADDLIIFSTATSKEAATIKSCLDKYCLWSGQSVNHVKSHILFSKNTSSSTITAIQNILPYDVTPATARHLGLPLLFGKSKVVAFSDILEKAQGKIAGWRSKTLSQAGKTVLVKVVASAIPSYAMSTFLLPDAFCHKLDIAFKNFWWGFPTNKARNLSLKSWSSLCLPKDQGGLGFRLMKDVNLSLVSKLCWKLLTNHASIWVPLFQQKYIKYGNLFSCPLGSGSWVWNGIKSIIPLLAKGSCFVPHFNSSLPIWTSPWIPTIFNFSPTPRFPHLPHSHPFHIADLIYPSSMTWRLDLLHFLFSSASVAEILKISIRSTFDYCLWTPSTTGIFTTKFAHHLLSSSTYHLPSPLPPSSWKSLWKLKINHRLKLFLWKMIWNIIPTKFRISQSLLSSPMDISCSLCSGPIDSVLHLFFSCPIARVVWRQSFWPLDILAFNIADMTDWFSIILNPARIGIPLEDFHKFQIFAMVACDHIWFSRNKAHHEDLVPDALAISAHINKLVQEHFLAWKSSLPRIPEV
jgi:exonuclease III